MDKILDLTHIKWEEKKDKNGVIIPEYRYDDFIFRLAEYNEEDGFSGVEPIYEELAFEIGKLVGIKVAEVRTDIAKVIYNGKEDTTFVTIIPNYGNVEGVIPLKDYKNSEEFEIKDFFKGKISKELRAMLEFDILIDNADRDIDYIWTDGENLAPLMCNYNSMGARVPFKEIKPDMIGDYDTKYLKNGKYFVLKSKDFENQMNLKVPLCDFDEVVDKWAEKYEVSFKKSNYIKDLLRFRYKMLQNTLSEKVINK